MLKKMTKWKTLQCNFLKYKKNYNKKFLQKIFITTFLIKVKQNCVNFFLQKFKKKKKLRPFFTKVKKKGKNYNINKIKKNTKNKK